MAKSSYWGTDAPLDEEMVEVVAADWEGHSYINLNVEPEDLHITAAEARLLAFYLSVAAEELDRISPCTDQSKQTMTQPDDIDEHAGAGAPK